MICHKMVLLLPKEVANPVPKTDPFNKYNILKLLIKLLDCLSFVIFCGLSATYRGIKSPVKSKKVHNFFGEQTIECHNFSQLTLKE